jgi:Ca-activated chloride channel family protein
MRSRRRWILPLPLCALLVAATLATAGPHATNLTLTGRVLDGATERPLSAAQVYVHGTRLGALTDVDGRYTIVAARTQLPSAELDIRAVLIGYGEERATVRVTAGLNAHTLTTDFRLRQVALRLDEVVVSGTARATRRRVIGNAVATLDAGARVEPAPTSRAHRPAEPDARRPHEEPRLSGDRRGGNREQYDYIEDNDFRSVADEALSTFSIDVDRASYSNVRRFLLREQRLPPIDAVQIEEMVNYFSYDYEMPGDSGPVAVTTELGIAPWAPEHRLLRVGLASRPMVSEELPPSNLVFLLDVSGSMRSPDKLPLVKESLRLLVDQLRPADRVAIAVYAGAAGLALESTPGSRKDEILDAIERLEAGGSTAGGEGLRLAYHVAQRHFRRGGNNRVILATDGDFNVGESSDAAMVRLVEERRGQGTFLTILGFGTGNLQSAKMQSLAQHGNGNYAYIDDLAEARKVLVHEMGGTLVTVAQDVKLQIEFNPAHVSAYRLIGYANRLLATEDFNDDAKDAGDLGAGHRVTALYEIVPVGVDHEAAARGVDALRYQNREPEVRRARTDELAFVRIRYKRPRGTESRLVERPVRSRTARRPSVDFSFASAVAGFGMILRDSQHRGSITTDQVLELAERGLGEDLDGYRGGFIELVRAYRKITGDAVVVRDDVR